MDVKPMLKVFHGWYRFSIIDVKGSPWMVKVLHGC